LIQGYPHYPQGLWVTLSKMTD